MTFINLALAYLCRRWGQAALAIVVGALGIGSVTSMLITIDAIPEAAERTWGGVDIIVGPKGSALDLVLCCVLHVSEPRGLVSQKAAMQALSNPMMVRAATPIALGDNVDGFRIMGATPAVLNVYRASLAKGRIWNDKLEAVLGANVADRLHMKIGDSFVGAHGLAAGGDLHASFPYHVVGILQPTGSALDRLVLTDMETVRYIHAEQTKAEIAEHGSTDEPNVVNLPDAATAVIASFRNPIATAILPRQIDATDTLSAANPSLEVARLLSYARPVTVAIAAIGVLLVVIAAIAAAIGLMATINARTRDLSLLRALGAGPMDLAVVAIAEAAMIGAVALVLGLTIASAFLIAIRSALFERSGLLLSPHVEPEIAALVIAGTVVAIILAAIVPAIRAARSPIEELLQS